ncbi:large subunit ribosomal protein L22e [Pancytospora philotis]|nr:large subunit ribosomal protein L22e [Pancytospora philotis]
MSETEVPMRTYTIEFKEQVDDDLVHPEGMIEYLENIMKVFNSRVRAQREIKFVDNGSSVGVVSKHGNIEKKNMKLYIKRFLRSKGLAEFIKVSGDSADGFKLRYVNKVDEVAE